MLMSTLQLYSTPLHVATRTGHTAVVEYLLSSGAKINSRDRVDCSWIVFNFCASVLLQKISVINTCFYSQEGDTALHDAVHLNRYKIVKLLIAAGADTRIKNHVSFANLV